LKAACEAAQYVHPTFKATAVVHARGDFADRLQRAIERSNGGRLIEAKTVEHSPTELRPEPTSANERSRFIPRRRV
jgi:hypothetical protein